MKKIFPLIFLFVTTVSIAQTQYNDGRIRLRVWVNKVWSSANCSDPGSQEYVWRDIRVRPRTDILGTGWSPNGVNIQANMDENRWMASPWSGYQLPSGSGFWPMTVSPTGVLLLDISYPSTAVPTSFDWSVGQTFENDCGDSWIFESSCGFLGLLGDETMAGYHEGLSTNPFRSVPEGQIGYVQTDVIDAGSAEDDRYAVLFAFQWDWVDPLPPLPNTCGYPKYQDGPVNLDVELVGVWCDVDYDMGFNCVMGLAGAEDLRVRFRSKDNLSAYSPSVCINQTPGPLGLYDQQVPQWNVPGPVSLISTSYNTLTTDFESFELEFETWEEDPFPTNEFVYESDDDAYVPPVSTGAINWRSSPPNTWNYLDLPIRASSSEYENWTMWIRYRWTQGPPVIVTQPSAAGPDRVFCTGTPTSLDVVATSTTFYQWQVTSVTGPAGPSCPASGWTDIAGANCPTYVPPQTPGTRIYRCLLMNRTGSGSTGPAGDRLYKVYTDCVRITYFDFSPVISSTTAVCSSTVLPGTIHTFCIPAVPALGAVANATFTWSATGPAAITPSPLTGPCTDITFPSTSGTYTIYCTLDNAGLSCAPTTANEGVSICYITVTEADCGIIYASPSGNPFGVGTPSDPVTLPTALSLSAASGGVRDHIRMLEGTYNIGSVIDMINDVIIEGGFRVSGGEWYKTSNAVTTLNFSGTESINNYVGHVIGIKATGVTNWTLQDLTITTANAAGFTANGNGKSNYAILINNASNYNIIRCNISSGNATNGDGKPGGTGGTFNASWDGADGANGGNGGAGQTGECNGGTCDRGGDGGNGGTGGAGGFSPAGNNGGNGGSGGFGGAGGDEDCVGATNNCAVNQTSSGQNGARGSDGASGNAGINGGGGGSYGPGACGGSGSGGADGGTGSDANNGSFGGSGTTVANSFGAFVTPGYGTNGGGGGGAGGGGGGGGGSYDTDFINDDGGCGGHGGSAGGGGGGGGRGAGGGGHSYGIYIYNNGTGGLIVDTYIACGTAGTGGQGGQGGTGGSPGTRLGPSNGSYCDGDEGGSGGGGSGATGGNGGQGGNGTSGIRYALANLNAAGTFTTTGEPTLLPGGFITVNSSVSGGSVPNPLNPVSIIYNNDIGCTNSEITITKPSGTWDMAAYFVDDISNGITSYTNNSSPAVVSFSSTGAYDLLTSGADYESYIRINHTRPLPQILGLTPANDTICYGQSIDLITDIGGAAQYQWVIQQISSPYSPASPGSDIFSGNQIFDPAAIIITNPGPANITYQVRLRIKDQCCGWSRPVYMQFVVLPSLTAGTIAADQYICYGQVPADIISVVNANWGNNTVNYQWLQSNDGVSWIPATGTPLNGGQDFSPSQPVTATLYFIRYINGGVCADAYSNMITINILPEKLAGTIGTNHDICYNTNPSQLTSIVNASGGSGSGTYFWQVSDSCNGIWVTIPLSNSPAYQPPGPMTNSACYRRAVVDSICPDTLWSNVVQIHVQPPVHPGVIAPDQTICSNMVPDTITSVVNAFGGYSGFSYTWEQSDNFGATWQAAAGILLGVPPGADFLPTAPPAGVTRLYRRVAANTSCPPYTVVSDTVSLTVVQQFVAGIVPPAVTFCDNGVPVQLIPVNPGGIWSGVGIIDSVAGIFDPSIAGTGIHAITLSMDGSCGDTTTIALTVYTFYDATITPAGPFCILQGPVGLSAVNTGGIWSGTGITDSLNGTFDPAIAGPGYHTITYGIDAICGDTATLAILVTPVADPTITVSDTILCTNESPATLSAVDTGGVWSGQGIINSSAGVFDPVVAGTGAHQIIYTISGLCGGADTISLSVFTSPDATINPAGPFCIVDSTHLLAAADPGGVWSGQGISDSLTGLFDPALAGTGQHTITYLISGICSDSSQVVITVLPQADATIISTGPYCDNNPALVLTSATGGGNWSGSGITNPSAGTFNPSVAGEGTHQIIYTISGNCGDSDTAQITVNKAPLAKIHSNEESCIGSNDGMAWVQITSGIPPFTFLWDNNSVNDTIANLSPGTWTVTLTDSNNCGWTGQATIEASGELCFTPHIYVPNIFSPNGDGENDHFAVRGEGVTSISVNIYDRWGEKIYEIKSMDDFWDGTFHGKQMDIGVYTYQLEVTFIDDTSRKLKGSLTLVR